MKLDAGRLRPTPTDLLNALRRNLPALALFGAALVTGFVATYGPTPSAAEPPLALAAVSSPPQPEGADATEAGADFFAASDLAIEEPAIESDPIADEPAAVLAVVEEADEVAVGSPPLAASPWVAWTVIEGSIPEGSSLAGALADQSVSPADVHVIATQMAPVFNFRYSRAGDRFRLEQAEDGTVLSFHYRRSALERYHLARVEDGYLATRHEPRFVRSRARLAGVVSTSLYQAIESLGEHPQVAHDFANIFAWDVDFSRGVRPGDTFSVLYERLMVEGEGIEEDVYARPDRILAARYTTQGDEFRAVYYERDEATGGYYRPDGSSVERYFLRAPLQYNRISSAFSLSRMHPILKVRRPHPGIDYAAPSGTPVWAVANGEVIYRGAAGGYGNLVKVRHRNGFISYYGHLSRFDPALRVGSRVSQKQVIGYVGATGLATGPHLDFRVRKDGKFINPTKLRTPAGDPIPGHAQASFQGLRDQLLAELDPPTVVVVSEAL